VGSKKPSMRWGGAHWRHLANTMDRSAAAAMRAVATITVAKCHGFAQETYTISTVHFVLSVRLL